MSGGMGMMLKAMGVDPDAIKAQAQTLGAGLQEFQKTLARIEVKIEALKSIESKLDYLINMPHQGEIPISDLQRPVGDSIDVQLS